MRVNIPTGIQTTFQILYQPTTNTNKPCTNHWTPTEANCRWNADSFCSDDTNVDLLVSQSIFSTTMACKFYFASLLILLASSIYFSDVRSLKVPRIPQQRNAFQYRISMSSVYASASDDIKGLVSRAEMILIVPISTVRTEYISGSSAHNVNMNQLYVMIACQVSPTFINLLGHIKC